MLLWRNLRLHWHHHRLHHHALRLHWHGISLRLHWIAAQLLWVSRGLARSAAVHVLRSTWVHHSVCACMNFQHVTCNNVHILQRNRGQSGTQTSKCISPVEAGAPKRDVNECNLQVFRAWESNSSHDPHPATLC